MFYNIKALKCGEKIVPGPEMFYMSKWNEYIKVFTYVWFITDGKTKILVDTGLRDVNEINKMVIPDPGEKCKFVIPEGEDIISVLKKNNLTPQSIDYVILTHLHYDHISNSKLFTNAKTVLSRKGLKNTLKPEFKSMIFHPLFPKDVLGYFKNEIKNSLILADEEETIIPGIKVFWVGGHTMCSQAVSVETKKGKVIICGDIVFLYENIEKNIPVGLMYNIIECFRGMERIKNEADIILPGHDPKILDKYANGTIC
jgi:N-acyl homoserine lactone hydrolase